MKKALPWIIVVVILLAIFLLVKNTYNSLVSADEAASSAWAQVENVYQRRSDLIPNLVATVKGYAEYEGNTLQEVVEARAKATQVTVDPERLDEESIARFQESQTALGSALGRLMVVVEKYPDLKANQNFLDLQAQLEGTENRISVERKNFNEVVQSYNTKLRRFPSNIIGNIFGFEKKGYFKAVEGAEVAPQVEF